MKVNFWILVVLLMACSAEKKKSEDFLAGEIVGELTIKALEEASGLVASQANPGFFWTINDSGNSPDVFLVDDKMDIKLTCKLSGITNRDWEDVAIGYDPKTKKNYIHVAEIGDNDARYVHKMIYRFEEPVKTDSTTLTIKAEQVQKIVFQFPEGAKDSEALMIDPLTHDIYVISKREMPVHVYRLAYPQSMQDTLTAQPVAALPFTQVTAANFSVDGTEMLVKNYDSIFYFSRDTTTSVQKMLTDRPKVLNYIPEPQGESIAWSLDGSGYYTVSEKIVGRKSNLLFYKRK
jgi:hypothetical protein